MYLKILEANNYLREPPERVLRRPQWAVCPCPRWDAWPRRVHDALNHVLLQPVHGLCWCQRQPGSLHEALVFPPATQPSQKKPSSAIVIPEDPGLCIPNHNIGQFLSGLCTKRLGLEFISHQTITAKSPAFRETVKNHKQVQREDDDFGSDSTVAPERQVSQGPLQAEMLASKLRPLILPPTPPPGRGWGMFSVSTTPGSFQLPETSTSKWSSSNHVSASYWKVPFLCWCPHPRSREGHTCVCAGTILTP